MTSVYSAAIQTLVEVLRIEMALRLNNSDAGGGIHNECFHEAGKKKSFRNADITTTYCPH